MYERLPTCTDNVLGHIRSYRPENKSIRVVFRIDFDGLVRFCVAVQKSMFLSMFMDFFDVFCNFFVF